MIEIMNSMVKRDGGTGPGPQNLLAGDYTDGYFGSLSSNDFVKGSELSSMVNFVEGSLTNDILTWLKFSLDGKILFVPKNNIRKSISWEMVYKAGCVYGTNDYGITPLSTPVNQLRIVNVKGSLFKVRLFKTALTDPIENISSQDNPALSSGSEWNRLMYRIVMEADIGALEKWEMFPYSTVSDDYYSLCQETLNSSIKRAMRGGYDGISFFHSRDPETAASNYGWRPILELITN